MNFMPVLAAAEPFAYGTWGEKFALCGRMLLTGMGTVFLVLVILWGVIAVFGAVAKMSERREQQRIMEEVRNSPAPNDMKKGASAAPVPEPEAAPAEDDGVLIAVITAAIEAYRVAEGKPAGSYRVVSFRQKKTRKRWNGRADG